MDVKGKTKDNPKPRADMKNICRHPLLELVEVSPEKFLKPKASYILMREQLKDVCEWCKNFKFQMVMQVIWLIALTSKIAVFKSLALKLAV